MAPTQDRNATNPLWELASEACQSLHKGHDPANCRVCLAIYGALKKAVATEREACAVVCDQVQAEGDQRSHDSADPADGSDGAGVAAGRIRARP